MDYTLIIFTPNNGRLVVGCSTMTEVQNHIVEFIRRTPEQNYTISVEYNP